MENGPFRVILAKLPIDPGNGKSFKQRGKAAGWFGPGHRHHARAVGGTVAARRLGVQDGAVLASVEVAPLAFGLMVVGVDMEPPG